MIPELVNVLLGVLVGTFTGLIPGIHVNLLLALFFSLSLEFTNPSTFTAFIASLTMTHVIVSFIPSILLGAPDDENLESALPSHRLLLEGRGYTALFASVVGCAASIFLALLSAPVILTIVLEHKSALEALTPFMLSFLVLACVLSEKTAFKKTVSFSVILLSGLFGVLTVKSSWGFQPLFPVFTGLFALSPLLYSFMKNESVPRQEFSLNEVSFKDVLSNSLKGVFGGALIGFLPAVGPAQAAFLFSLTSTFTTTSYLVLVASIVTASNLFNVFALFLFEEAHSGSWVAILDYLGGAPQELLLVAVSATLVSVSVSSLLTLHLFKTASRDFALMDYKEVNALLLVLLSLLVLRLTGFTGFLMSLTAMALSLTVLFSRVKRISLMSFLTVPTILFYWSVI